MIRLVKTIFWLALATISSLALAKDEMHLYSIQEAMKTQDAKVKLDPGVQLIFANNPYPVLEKNLGRGLQTRSTHCLTKHQSLSVSTRLLMHLLNCNTVLSRRAGMLL